MRKMTRKIASVVCPIIVFIGVLILTFNIQPVEAENEIIYIRADGNVDPPTAPIYTDDNVTYIIVENINGSIDVERDNIVVDGAGHTLQGPGGYNSTGIYLLDRNNVTIMNTEIKTFGWAGIYLVNSSGNTIFGDNITGNGEGIWLTSWSNNNTICHNIIANNRGNWIRPSFSYGNRIYHNNFVDGRWSNPAYWSESYWDDDYPSGGNFWDNYAGNDTYSGPYQNETGSDGIGDTPYVIWTDTPYADEHNQDNYPLMEPLLPIIPPPHPPIARFTYSPTPLPAGEATTFDASPSFDYGDDIVSYSWDFGDGNTTSTVNPTMVHTYKFEGWYTVTLTVSNSQGSSLPYSQTFFVIMRTHVSISTSSPSTLVGYKVNLTGTLSDIYGSGLESETVVLYYTFSGIDTWIPITSGVTDSLGRYHAVWIPPATGYFTIKVEWIGNTTHVGINNTTTLSSLTYDDQYVFAVESNSTISELAFNTTNWLLSFTATGPNCTEGYVKVTVAKNLVFNTINIRVYLNDEQSEYSITSTDDSWLVTFDYTHSTHQVVIDLDVNIIPEFPPFLILPLSMMATLLTVIVYKKFNGKKKEYTKSPSVTFNLSVLVF